jgi:WD40 repeat protein
VRLYELATGKELGVLKGHREPGWAVAFSPDSSRVVTHAQDGTVKRWDAQSAEEIMTVGRVQTAPGLGSVAFSSDGWKVVAAAWTTSGCGTPRR